MEQTLGDLVRLEIKATQGLQLETSFSYRLRTKEGIKKGIPKEFHVESFFFLPSQLNLNSSTYPIESFYRDMKSFINFRIPRLSYKELVGIGKNHINSPLFRIEQFILQNANRALNQQKRKYLLQELRVWACALHNYTERRLQKLRKIESHRHHHGLKEDISTNSLRRQKIQNLRNISHIFRVWSATLQKLFNQYESFSWDSEILSIDEYVFMLSRDFTFEMQRLSRIITNNPAYMNREIKVRLRLLRWYAHHRGFFWLEAQTPDSEIEDYIYKKAALKREIWSSLYLETRAQSLFKFRKQLGAMLAAGFAGFWAVLAEILINRNGSNTRTLNTSGFILITALVLAYILKDRIKELGRTRFKSGLFGRLPDSQSKLLFDAGNTQRSVEVGTYSEKAYYDKIDNIPKDMPREILDHNLNGDYIYYSKRIMVYRNRILKLGLKIRAIYDFFRISMQPLMFYVENNTEEVFLTDRKLNYIVDTMPKVYKIDLVFKISGKVKPKHKAIWRHYQITVSKNRIHHIRAMPTGSNY